MRKLYCFVFVLFLNFLFSQEMPIQPEETPYLLNKGQLQIENGFSFRKIDSYSNSFNIPNLLIKIGFNNFFEFRVQTELQYNNTSNNENTSGFLPLGIGFKTKLWKEKKWIPEAALVSQVFIPKISSKQFNLNYYAPEAIIMMQGNYSKKYSVNYNTGIKWDGFSNNPYFTYKWTHNYILTNWLNLYSEIQGHIHTEENTHSSINSGLMFQLSQNTMLDVSGGFGLNKETTKYFSALIFSIRI